MAKNRLTEAAYQCLPGGPLDVNKDLYKKIASAPGRTIIDEFVLPIRSGKAWKVPQGCVCRINIVEAAQVGDLNIFSYSNPREHLWAARTRQLQRAHVSTYDRLWSNLPYLRPLCTITADSLADYGTDAEGARVHDLLGTRCDPYINQALSGQNFDYCCHSNLTRAVMEWGLTEADVHDVLNVFQATGLNAADQYYMKACPARKGDFFEFFAETDLLCALSTCPGGDLSLPMWGEGAAPTEPGQDPTLSVCRPLGVQVFSLADGLLESAGWEEPAMLGRAYKGQHGLQPRPWADVLARQAHTA